MKLTSIELHPTNSNDVAVLSFRDPYSNNPYAVLGITGLDATDGISPRQYGSTGSSTFHDLSLQSRQIVFQIGLNPDYADSVSFSDLRDALYRMIASSRVGTLQIQFKNQSDAVAAVSGFVTKFENAIFNKAQVVQMTVQCIEPMLKALDPETIIVSELDPYNFIISDDKSTAPHGFSFNLQILDYIPSLTISDPDDASWVFVVIPGTGFLPDDEVICSSEYNNKQLYILRSGAEVIQLADVIVPGSIWPILFPGDNSFRLSYDPYVKFNSIQHYPTYWGV